MNENLDNTSRKSTIEKRKAIFMSMKEELSASKPQIEEFQQEIPNFIPPTPTKSNEAYINEYGEIERPNRSR
jgi:hypothetical protein